MLRIFFFFILICFISCAEKQETSFDNSPSTSYDLKELELYKKPQDLILSLSYDSTTLVGEDTLLNFTFSVRNNTLEVYNLISHICPYYDPFKLEESSFIYLFPIGNCYSNGIGYKEFNQASTSTYNLQMKLENWVKNIENIKIRVGFEGVFGFRGKTVFESIELYRHMQVNFATYWSNYVVLKNDYKHFQN